MGAEAISSWPDKNEIYLGPTSMKFLIIDNHFVVECEKKENGEEEVITVLYNKLVDNKQHIN